MFCINKDEKNFEKILIVFCFCGLALHTYQNHNKVAVKQKIILFEVEFVKDFQALTFGMLIWILVPITAI